MDKQAISDDHFLNEIHRIIEENLDNVHFSIEDLAEQVGMDRSALHRKLIRLSGKSATDLLTEIRLKHAREMLEARSGTISEIAYRVGFSDQSYFSKVFKKYYGISPGEIKKTQTQEAPGHEEVIADRPKRKSVLTPMLKLGLWLILSLAAGYGIFSWFNQRFPRQKSIAVLPLQNLTGSPENAYFVEGMHDELIGELGQLESLRVISRTSTLHYRHSDKTLEDIARELRVNNIVEGSVLGAGDSLKLLIQLIKVFPDEQHLLVSEYRDNMQNALRVQRKAVKDIAQNINLRLSKKQQKQLEESRKVNPETYKDYLRGLYQLNQGTPESFTRGIAFMREAIRRDPGDPLAYAGLALGYAIQGHGVIHPVGSFRTATAAAERALMLDPSLDEAHLALALINTYQEWNWPKAMEDYELALANNPNNAMAHAHYGALMLLFNEKEKSIYHLKTAIMLEPTSAAWYSWLACFYYMYRDNDNAEEMALKAIELEENIPYGILVLGWLYADRGEFGKAIALQEKLPVYNDYYKMLIGYAYIKSGDREKVQELYNEMEKDARIRFINPFHRGMLAGMLGFNDRAFELFHEACEKKYYPIIYIDTYPGIESLKEDPRYCELKQCMHLPCRQNLIANQE